MLIHGYVTDKNKSPIANALIEVKGSDFRTLFSATSGEDGFYDLDIPAGTYPFLTAVKDYAVNYLEYWCQNIELQSDLFLDVSFDQLELYGLHVFTVKGGRNNLMAYFRPMSLTKFLQGLKDIAPENITVKAAIDHQEVPVLMINPVKEVADGLEMTAYLIQLESAGISPSWRRFDLEVRDGDGHYGAATLFSNVK